MDFISDFFNGFFGFINNLPTELGIITLIIVLLIFILTPQIKSLFTWLVKKIGSKKRSCGDCILIIFGISDKYRTKQDNISRNILNKKMTYVEQKIEYIILELLKTYKEYQSNISKQSGGYYHEIIDKEFWGYKHAMINAVHLFKHEIKRSFLENGFHLLSGQLFSIYVKDKTKELVSIYQNFIMTDYPKEAFVNINYLFDNFDIDWFEDIIFEIFIKAKEIEIESDNNIKLLEQKLKEDIDCFIKEKK